MVDSTPERAVAQPGAPAGDGADAAAVPRVVLVLARHARRDPLRALLRGLVPDAKVQVATGNHDATFRLALGGVDLVVLDLQCEPEQPWALVQMWFRLSPASLFVLLGGQKAPAAVAPHVTEPWSRAEPVLRRALETLGAFGGARVRPSARTDPAGSADVSP